MPIQENLIKIKNSIPENVTLVAVSKTKPIESILEAYEAGQRIFGENKIQEMTEKWQQLPKDISWQMIGHIQTNKIKFMAEYVDLIHGVDSLKVLIEINKQAKKHNRVINCLLQIYIAEEDTKFGFNETEVKNVLESIDFQLLKNINIVGLMGMASFTEDNLQVEKEFLYLKKIYDDLAQTTSFNKNFSILSMGMSGDYETAIKCGSNMIRVGSSIFGGRS